MNLFADTKEFIHRPFNEDMNLVGWLLFIGMIMLIALLWHSVINLIIV